MLTFGFGQPFGVSQRLFGSIAVGSIAVAEILYSSPFTYTLDANGNNLLTNQGSGADGLLYTGQGLEVLATQVFPIPIGTSGHCVAMYDIINTQWVYITATVAPSYTIPVGTYGHIAVLSIEPSVGDKVYLENNIDALKDLWFSRATGLTSIVKANIQHLYIPDALQGGTLFDYVNTIVGTEEVENNSFDTDTIWTKEGAGTAIAGGQVTLPLVGPTDVYQPSTHTSGDSFYVEIDIASIVGTVQVYMSATADTLKTIFRTKKTGISGGFVIARTTYIVILCGDGNSAIINSISIKKVSGGNIAVPNYLATMYTNADINSKGQQTLSDESIGIVSEVSDGRMYFRGNQHINTQWIPPSNSNWTVIVAFDNLDISTLCVVFAANLGNLNSSTQIIIANATQLSIALGANTSYAFTVTKAVHHVAVVYDSSTKSFSVYHNGVFKATTISSGFTTGTQPAFIGALNNVGVPSYWYKGSVYHKEQHDLKLSNQDITEAYNTWLLTQ